ncbi:response regulator [Pseudoclavibacter terrae]|uniref:Transcriptional regulatory protein n=1 Tax=Pseudoclavibacter terrae TaxID=1530195 RepID=A0A7J5AZU5_9MICO|nr:response regulator [Pseudoclavibacter terrae]KAB1636693.1 response regulator [Pseudoclavibacter terrae]
MDDEQATQATPLNVLIVDDEPLTAQAHASYVDRLPGFRTVAVAGTASAALLAVRASAHGDTERIDVVLLDINMPDATGIDVARRLRAEGHDVDIIAVTAVREAATVKQAVSLGIAHYLLKPFTFQTFAEKLEALREYRAGLFDHVVSSQDEVDQTLASLRQSTPQASLPKGLTSETLASVISALRSLEAGTGISAKELSEQLALSRVTARRYLEHLVDTSAADRTPRYGTPGRPELEYRLA